MSADGPPSPAADCGLLQLPFPQRLHMENSLDAACSIKTGKMRQHLLKSLQDGEMTAFPLKKNRRNGKRYRFIVFAGCQQNYVTVHPHMPWAKRSGNEYQSNRQRTNFREFNFSARPLPVWKWRSQHGTVLARFSLSSKTVNGRAVLFQGT